MTPSCIKQQIADLYKFRIEMHAHTSPMSRCSEIPPEKLIEIYSQKGYHAIVISNHFTNDEVIVHNADKETYLDMYLKDYEKAKEAGDKCGITVLLATELRFTENSNDYLIYGVNRDILSQCFDYFDKGLEVFRKEVNLPESVFVQAHPFRVNMTEVDSSLLDGIEAFNMHPGHNSRIGLAVKYAYQKNLGIMIAGSDFHHINVNHEAVSALRTKTLPKDSFELAAILKSGDYVFEIGGNSIVLP